MSNSKDDAIREIQNILVDVVEDNSRLKAELELVKKECSSLTKHLKHAVEEIDNLKSQNRADGTRGVLPKSVPSNSKFEVQLNSLRKELRHLSAGVEVRLENVNSKIEEIESDLTKSMLKQSGSNASMHTVQNSATQNQLGRIESKMDFKIVASERKMLGIVKADDSKLMSTVNRQLKAVGDDIKQLVDGSKDAQIKLKASKRDSVSLQKDCKSLDYKLKRMEETLLQVEKNFLMKSQLKPIITEEVAMLTGSNSGCLVWKITNFSKQMSYPEDISKTFFSEPFVSGEFGYSMIVHVDFLIDRLGVFIEFIPSEFRDTLPPVFQHRRTFRILDQSARGDKRHIVRQQEPLFRSSMSWDWMTGNWGNPSFVTYSLLERTRDTYLKNDAIFVKVEVEPLTFSWAKTLVHDGLLLWRIDHYRRTKEESLLKVNEFVESAPFYTSSSGYRMQVRLQFTDCKMNIFPEFLVGEYDAILEDTFPHKTRFFVMDQTDATGNGTNLMSTASLDVLAIGKTEAKQKMSLKGCDGVAFPYDKIELSPYLVNDTVVLKIIVDPI